MIPRDKTKPLKLKAEPLPDDLGYPILEIGGRKNLPLLASSFSGALGVAAMICGVLASIVITQRLIKPVESALPILTTHSTSPDQPAEPEKPEDQPVIHVRNSFATPAPPQLDVREVPLPVTERIEPVEIPLPESPPTGLVQLDELDFDNPFVEKPKSDSSQKKPQPTARDLEKKKLEDQKRKAAQDAALAKKITRGAVLISQATPSYPRSAKQKRIQGRVIVTISIGTNGSVVRSSITRSSGNSALDQAALSAANKCRFKPAINGLGQAITSQKAIPFDFRLQ